MSDRPHPSPRDEFQDLWSALPVPGPVTVDQVQRRATYLAAWKHRRELAVAVVLAIAVGQTVTAYAFLAWPLALWEWAGIVYVIMFPAGLLWLTRAGRRQPSAAMEGTECVHVYRSLLEHEREANRGRALAFRALLVFGLIGHTAIIAVKYVPAAFWPIAAAALVAGGVIWQRGLARARLFQMHIDAMDNSQA